MSFKTSLQVFCYYLLPLGLAGILGWHIYQDTLSNFTHESGEIALNALVLLLSIRPLSQIFWKVKFFRTLTTCRRELGIAMFYLALAHSASYTPVIWQFPQVLMTPFVYIGLIAFTNTFILYLTSNNYSLKLLKKNWKKLHRSVYLILILTLLHSYLATDKTEQLFKAVLILGFLGILNFLVYRKFKIPKISQKPV